MKINGRQFALGILALLLLALGIWAYGYHFRAESAVADYKQQLRAAGEKLTMDELWPRTLRREENSAGTFKQFSQTRHGQRTLLDTNGPAAMRMVATGKAMVGWAQATLYEESTNTWEEVEAVLAQDQEAVDLLEQITERPALDFQLDYRKGFVLVLPHLSPLKQAAIRLSQGAVFDLHRKQTDLAARKVRAMLAIAKGMADERLVISQLVRIAIAQIAVAANWELLQSPDRTDAQLAVLQADWTSLEFFQPIENALLMERAMTEATLEQMRNSSDTFRSVASGWSGTRAASSSQNWFEQAAEFTVLKAKETAWNYSWSYPDQLKALKGHQVIIDAARLLKNGQTFETAFHFEEKKLAELGIEARKTDSELPLFDLNGLDLRTFFSGPVVSLQRLLHRVLAAEAARRITITAIALDRHHLRHGRYPPDLAALDPEFLPAIPRDPVDGQSLRYRLDPDGTFLLYSIGEDGQDNGGDGSSTMDSKSFQWLGGRDLVWPRPATPAEVAAHYQKLSTRRGAPVKAPSPEQPATNAAPEGGNVK